MRDIKKKQKKGSIREFKTGIFQNPSAFVLKLKNARDPMSVYIRDQLSSRYQKMINSYDESKPPSDALLKGLVDKLNQLIAGRNLYDEDRFSNVSISKNTRKLIKKHVGKPESSSLNIALLQDAYPDEVKLKAKSTTREYVESFAIAIIAALIIRALFIQAFKIPTGSMEDTLLIGDFLLVNKFIYGAEIPFTGWRLPAIREPKTGDIVIFKYPEDPTVPYVKRCIAVGGQTVEIKDKVVYVDGKPMELPPEAKNDYPLMAKGVPDPAIWKGFSSNHSFNPDNFGPITVPEDHLFMMGDNRGNSLDSRFWGFVPRENVIGEPIIIYWSWEYNIPLYKIFSKVRWSRIADIIH